MLPAWVVPAPSLLNDPPAAMKALCNFKMHSLALHLAVLVRQKFSVGSSGDDRFESNMHSGQDDEDLQKALAFWLIALRLGGRVQSICTKPWLFCWNPWRTDVMVRERFP